MFALLQLEEAKFFYRTYYRGRRRGTPRKLADGPSPAPSPFQLHTPRSPAMVSASTLTLEPPLLPAASRVVRSLDLAGVLEVLPALTPRLQHELQHCSPPVAAEGCGSAAHDSGPEAPGTLDPGMPRGASESGGAGATEACSTAARVEEQLRIPVSALAGAGRAGAARSPEDLSQTRTVRESWGLSDAAAAAVAAGAMAADETDAMVAVRRPHAVDKHLPQSGGLVPCSAVEPWQGLPRASSLPLLAPALAHVAERFEARKQGYLAEWSWATPDASEAVFPAEAAPEASAGSSAAEAWASASRPPCSRAASAAAASLPAPSRALDDRNDRKPGAKRASRAACNQDTQAGGMARPCDRPWGGDPPGATAGSGRPTLPPLPLRRVSGCREASPAPQLPGAAAAAPTPGVEEGHAAAAAPLPMGEAAAAAAWRSSIPAPAGGRHAGPRAWRRAQRRSTAPGARLQLEGGALGTGVERGVAPSASGPFGRGAAPCAGALEDGAATGEGPRPAGGALRDSASAVWLSAASPAPAAAAVRRSEWPDPLAWTAEAACFTFRTLALSFDDVRVPCALRPLVQASAPPLFISTQVTGQNIHKNVM